MLSKSDMLAVCTETSETFTVPEWKGDIILRRLDLGQRLAFAKAATEVKGDALAGARAQFGLAAVSIVDAAGEPLFTPAEVEGLEPTGFKRVMERVVEMNGLATTPEEAKAAVKN